MGKNTPEQIIIDAFEGSRKAHSTFKKWSDDTFIGYVTASINLHNLNVNMTVTEWEALIRSMLKEGKI